MTSHLLIRATIRSFRWQLDSNFLISTRKEVHFFNETIMTEIFICVKLLMRQTLVITLAMAIAVMQNSLK